ncbi:rod shape-determining protein MreC [Candidatus Daviesbacteria bacterium]|nr:rod shape-determining protein MreC [Candidatus Daviesbacteria bacterium]
MEKVFPNLQLFLILILISVLIFAGDSFRLFNYPQQGVYFLTNPISFGLYNLKQKIGKQLHFIVAARFAAQENKAMQNQLAGLLSEIAQLKRKLAETESLLLQQQHLDPRTYNLKAARPIGLDRYLRIDKGEQDGLKVGQAVIFKDNYIGKIISISSSSSNIQILTDPDSKISAFSINKNGKAMGLLAGQFGTETLLDKILHEEAVEEGDLVYSEGTEGFLPRGLILGKVVKVLVRENEVFKQAQVVPVLDIRDLDLVFVMTE